MGGLARKSNTRDVSTVKRFFDSLKMNNIRNKFSKMENEAVRGVGDGDDNDDNAATPPPPPLRANSHLDNGGCHHIYGKTTPGDYVDAPPPPPDETAAGGALANDTNPNNSFGSCGAGEELIEYGCGRVRPPLLRGCANIHFFLACHCALLLLYGLIYAYIASIQTTLERQFQINAKRASLLASANMIGYLPALIVVSYYGGRGHRPRYIAVGMLVVTAGSFFASLPYFAYGLKQEAQTAVVSYAGGNVSRVATEELCLRADSGANSTGWGCAGGAAAAAMNNGAYALVFAGMVMVGAGGASVVTLGFPYIDDNVTPKSSPLYLGIAFSARVFGPVLGYLMGTLCTGIYVDLSDPGFDISSPNWLGAWWLGFDIVALCIIPAALLLLGFPKKLRNLKPLIKEMSASSTTRCLDAAEERLDREELTSPVAPESAAVAPPGGHKGETVLQSMEGLARAVVKLGRNVIFRTIIIGACADVFIVTGFFTYLPKYLELQFYQTPPQANTYSGIVAVLAMALATLAGGWLVKRFRLEPRGVMVLVLSCAIVWSLGNLILMGIGCPNVRWAGTIENNMLDVRTNCTAECSCTSARFSPVCGDVTTFFSPCHAGCTEQSADSKTYNSCACVESGWAQRDTCESHCDSHVSFIVILFFLVFYVNLRNTGHMMITIRCVDKDHKDIALGVAQVCTGLIGVIPGPVLYATAIDTACELFADNCGQQGHCLVYDNERFRFLYHGISAAIGVVPIAAYAVVLVKCHDMRFDENHANSLAAAAAAADADARRETVMSQYESSV